MELNRMLAILRRMAPGESRIIRSNRPQAAKHMARRHGFEAELKMIVAGRWRLTLIASRESVERLMAD